MKKNILLLVTGVCVGLAIYHFSKKKESKYKDDILMKAAMNNPWVSYDNEIMEEQRRYIDDLLDNLDK